MKDARKKNPPPGILARLDGRVKILLMIAACFVCQYTPAIWLPVWIAALGLLLFSPDLRQPQVGIMLRASIWYIAFWLVMSAGSDMVMGKGLAASVRASLPLCARLLALTLVGIVYAGIARPMETGKAATWFLKPFLGKNAWRPALAIALVAWFLPITLRLAGQVRAGMRARGLVLPWWKTPLLLVGTALRILEHTAGELAVGLASRRLDDWRSWTR